MNQRRPYKKGIETQDAAGIKLKTPNQRRPYKKGIETVNTENNTVAEGEPKKTL